MAVHHNHFLVTSTLSFTDYRPDPAAQQNLVNTNKAIKNLLWQDKIDVYYERANWFGKIIGAGMEGLKNSGSLSATWLTPVFAICGTALVGLIHEVEYCKSDNPNISANDRKKAPIRLLALACSSGLESLALLGVAKLAEYFFSIPSLPTYALLAVANGKNFCGIRFPMTIRVKAYLPLIPPFERQENRMQA